MSTIERRLSSLEQRAGTGGERVTVILRTFFKATPDGPVKTEPRALVSLTHGWRLDRQPGETVEAFIDRAGSEAPITTNGITRLLEERACTT